jgi:hypothetical protein
MPYGKTGRTPRDAPEGFRRSRYQVPERLALPNYEPSLVLVPGHVRPKTRRARPTGEAGIGFDVLQTVTVTEGVTLPVTDGFPSAPTRRYHHVVAPRVLSAVG